MANNNNLRYVSLDALRFSRNRIFPYVKNFSNIGINFNTISKKYSRTNIDSHTDIYSVFFQDDERLQNDYTPFFDRSYQKKVEYLYNVSSNTEIENILTTICDTAIDYDDKNYICQLTLGDLKLRDEIKDKIQSNFKKVYTLLGYADGKTAWEQMYRFLIEGFQTMEIIYRYKKRSEVEADIRKKQERIDRIINQAKTAEPANESGKSKWINESRTLKKELTNYINKIKRIDEAISLPTSINISGVKEKLGKKDNEALLDWEADDLIPVEVIGFKPIPNDSIVPVVYDDETNGGEQIYLWKYMLPNNSYRVLHDYQISRSVYSQIGSTYGKLSYVERLIRNFNLTRKIEESRVAWNIMNAQYRMKMIIPLVNRLSSKAEQSLRQIVNKHKEELTILPDTGEVHINGNPNILYGKTIALPSRQGAVPDIDGVKYQGPDLTDMDAPKYFRENLWRDSMVPFSRFDRSGNVGALSLFKADGIPYDEIAFHKFVKRLQREFGATIRKGLYIQTLLDFPELKIDLELKLKLGLRFTTQSYFEEAKEAETNEAKLRSVDNLKTVVDDNNEPVFSMKYLYTQKLKFMTEEEWDTNRNMRRKEIKDNPPVGGSGANTSADGMNLNV